MARVTMMEIHIDVDVRRISWVIDVNEVDDRFNCFSVISNESFQWKKVVHHLNVSMEAFVSIQLSHSNVFVPLISKDNDVI